MEVGMIAAAPNSVAPSPASASSKSVGTGEGGFQGHLERANENAGSVSTAGGAMVKGDSEPATGAAAKPDLEDLSQAGAALVVGMLAPQPTPDEMVASAAAPAAPVEAPAVQSPLPPTGSPTGSSTGSSTISPASGQMLDVPVNVMTQSDGVATPLPRVDSASVPGKDANEPSPQATPLEAKEAVVAPSPQQHQSVPAPLMAARNNDSLKPSGARLGQQPVSGQVDPAAATGQPDAVALSSGQGAASQDGGAGDSGHDPAGRFAGFRVRTVHEGDLATTPMAAAVLATLAQVERPNATAAAPPVSDQVTAALDAAMPSGFKPGDANSVTVRLAPEELGEIRVTVSMDDDSKIHVDVAAQRGGTRDALAALGDDLRTSLSQRHGLELGSFNVDQDHARQGGNGFSGQHGSEQRNFAFERQQQYGAAETRPNPASSARAVSATARLVDVVL